MAEIENVQKRRVFRWSKEARDLVTNYKERRERTNCLKPYDYRELLRRLSELSRNPRDACLRFLRQSGIRDTRPYRTWTKREQQRLADLVVTLPVADAARALGRSTRSVRSMLHRLGLGGTRERDWFTKFSLSRALHTRPEQIQAWIDRGWLKSRTTEISGTKVSVIYGEDFCEFVKEHGHHVVGRRLSYEALWFVQNYVFPPSHADLLDVRGTYNKRPRTSEVESNAIGQTDAA